MIGIQYSKALFELSIEDKNTLEINEQLQIIVDVLRENSDIIKFFSNPSIKVAEKNKVIENVFAKFNKDVISFMKVVVANRRISYMTDICENYKKLASNYDRTVSAVVETKKALTKLEQDLLKGKLEKKLDKNVILIEKVKESMIGGFKVIVDGKIVDVTFDSKLQKLKNYL